MKYRLKDKELQRKLDEISGGDFSPRLQDAWSTNEGRSVATFRFGDDLRCLSGLKFCATFYEDEIEAIPEYDPTKWNEWPEVEPPEGVLMRVEVKYRDRNLDTPEPQFWKIRERCCAIFNGSCWRHEDGSLILFQMDRLVRFRPWDDCDEGDKK